MGSTIAEKILARASGQVRVIAGENIQAKPDFVVAYDFPGYTDVIFKQMKDEFGLTGVKDPSRYALFIDHMVPAVTPQEEELHQNTRDWGALNHVPVYERKGIGHQVASELGYATPGAFVVHFDGHISQLGTFGTLAMGVRRHLIESFVNEKIRMAVPATTRVDLVGQLQAGVMARDVFHHVVRVLGPASCRFQVLEFGGEAIADMGIDARQTLTCLAMFTGAVTAIINPDQVTLPYAQERARLTIEPLYSDHDATYAARHTIDISQLEPVVVIPPSPANTRNLVDHLGLPVQVMACPTQREMDGLPFSSRNTYLTGEQRQRAAALPKALAEFSICPNPGIADVVQNKETLLLQLRSCLEAAALQVEYLELVNPLSLQPLQLLETPALLAAAVRCGSTRLIDHRIL